MSRALGAVLVRGYRTAGAVFDHQVGHKQQQQLQSAAQSAASAWLGWRRLAMRHMKRVQQSSRVSRGIPPRPASCQVAPPPVSRTPNATLLAPAAVLLLSHSHSHYLYLSISVYSPTLEKA